MTVSKSMSLLVALLVSVLAAAQTPTGHVHASRSTPLTGASVPDIIAERLVLINLGVANPSSAKQDDLVQQSAFIHSIGLSTNEGVSLIEVANQFADTWHALIERHNRDAAGAVRSDASTFTVVRDDLVSTTMDQIRDTFSPQGYERFLVYIQKQKAFMQTWEAQ